MNQKIVLGKGLASLFQNNPVQQQAINTNTVGMGATTENTTNTAAHTENKARHMGISIVNIDDIHINPYQPRKEFAESAISGLSDSIKQNGIIQPLIVRKDTVGYQLIAGERRLRAAKHAGLKQVPIVLRRTTDRESLEVALIENIQRQDLSCVEEALAYERLVKEFSLTQEEIARHVGKDRATVANHLRILKLPEQVIEDLKKQKISFGHAKVLLSLEGEGEILALHKKIIEDKLSVRQTEATIQDGAITPRGQTEAVENTETTPVAQRIISLSEELRVLLSTKVKIQGDGKKGKIQIFYNSPQEFERLIELLHLVKR